MPTTVSALVVIVFAVVPGVFGETVYRLIIGTDWRQSEWERVVRIVTFSVGGVVLYNLALFLLDGLPIPSYLFERSVTTTEDSRMAMKLMTIAYVGHFVAASILGGVVAAFTRILTARTRMSTYPDSWDVFARKYVKKHWVAVTLIDGESFAGMVEKADTSVQRSERDVVLLEPAQYDSERTKYITMPYEYLYLPGTLIASIGVYYNPNVDPPRIVPINESLFIEPEDDGK